MTAIRADLPGIDWKAISIPRGDSGDVPRASRVTLYTPVGAYTTNASRKKYEIIDSIYFVKVNCKFRIALHVAVVLITFTYISIIIKYIILLCVLK